MHRDQLAGQCFFKKGFLFMRHMIRLAITLCLLFAISATVAPQVQAQAKASGEITVWMWKSNWDNITNSKVLDDFAKAYPDIKINRVDIAAGDVYQKLPLALSAGTGAPDVALVEDSALG